MTQANTKRRRACLIGVPTYNSSQIRALPVVRRDVTSLQAVLEESGYQVAAHCPAEGEPGISRSTLRTLITDACRAAEEGETLIIYFSGHGGHFNGKDYLIPCDADLRDPEAITDYLLPVDIIATAARDCKAETILFLIDACREGMKLDAKALALRPWAEKDRKIVGQQSIVTVFACARGQYAQYYEEPQSATQSSDSSYSLFTRALCQVLSVRHAARSLGDVLEAANKALAELVRQHRKATQEIWVLGESAASRRELRQLICDARADDAAGPNPWSDAVSHSSLWPSSPLTAQFKAAAIRLANGCWMQYMAARKRQPDDPWVDEQLPVRLLANLHLITSQLDRLELNAAEAALLCIAPLMREAVLARAKERLADHQPLKLEELPDDDHPLRRMVEKVHRAQPRLVRKATRLRNDSKEQAANHVALWLMHRALLREPSIWLPAEAPGGLLDGIAMDVTAEVGQSEPPTGDALSVDRLLNLARCCYGTPDRIEQRDRPGALKSYAYCTDRLGQQLALRERLLGYLLLVAGAMAIDARLLSEVLVEHVGLANTPPLADLLRDVSRATWEPDAAGRKLDAICTHPAPDFALRDHVEHANPLLFAAQRATEQRDCAPLAKLPTRFNADGVQAKLSGTTPAYQTPHLRFRLAQDQVLELLMGEQLYGDPSLAIRELYQNALDACRYAQARLTYLKRSGRSDALDFWTGRIRFRQDVDEYGRPYIECEDNGIGMSERELTESFTQAGRRFADTPEFIEEQMAWQTEGVKLFPNSQFGVGVLSYFMLADEFEVETRRMSREGHPGNEPLHVAIAGSGSLIRIRKGSRTQSGTRVRLYLSRVEHNHAPISVTRTLEELLWVAEFATEATHGSETLRWTPGRLGHDADTKLHAATCATANPDFWWRTSSGYNWPEQSFILADGLFTSAESVPPLCIVNLRAERKPQLTVDRKHALSWKSDWVQVAASTEVEPLVTWDTACLFMVGELSSVYPHIAYNAMSLMRMRKHKIPVANEYWISERLFNYRHRHERRRVLENLASKDIPLSIGCFYPDTVLLSLAALERFRLNISRAYAILSISYQSLPRRVSLSRLKTLAQNIDNFDWSELQFSLDSIDDFTPLPGDEIYLSWDLDGKEPWLEREVPSEKILLAAAQLKRSPESVVIRLRELGFTLPGPQPNWKAIGTLNEADEQLIWMGFDNSSPKSGREVSVGRILRAAAQLKRTPGSVVTRLRELGFTLPELQPNWEAMGTLTEADAMLIPMDLDGEGPWMEREVAAGEILRAAAQLKHTPAAVVARLRSLGFALPGPQPDWDAIGTLDEGDVLLISEDLDGRPPWLKREVPAGHVLRAVARLDRTPKEVSARLRELGFTLTEPQLDWGAIGTLDESDVLLISRDLDGGYPWLEREVLVGQVLRAAVQLNRTPVEIVARLRELGFTLAEPQPVWETIGALDESDVLLISSDSGGASDWLVLEVSAEYILHLAFRVNRTPAAVATRLRELGFILPGPDPVSIPVVVKLSYDFSRSPDEVIRYLRDLGFEIEPEVFPDELAIIVQVYHGCSREEARQRLQTALPEPEE